MTKIIYLTDRVYYSRDHHRFGLDYLMKRGYSVRIWRIIRPDSDDCSGIEEKKYSGDNYSEIIINDLRVALKDNLDAIYYLHSYETEISRLVMKTGCKYFLVDGMGMVMPYGLHINEVDKGTPGVKGLLLRKIGNISARTKRFVDDLHQVFLMKLNAPLFSICSTQTASEVYFKPKGIDFKLNCIHSYDYDCYLENQFRTSEKEYIVFCDSGFYDNDIDYEEFFGSIDDSQTGDPWGQMNDLFESLEEYYHLPVIIAGHPHTVYRDQNPTGRKMVFDSLSELVSKAAVFVVNTSTAISLAALYDVPILQVVRQGFKTVVKNEEGEMLYDYISFQAKELGCGFLDLDNDEQMKDPAGYVRRMDDQKRKEYIKKYVIDNDTTDRLVIEYIDDILKEYIDESHKGTV